MLEEQLDNNDVTHRSAIINVLCAKGLDAYEYHSGGGCFHVAVEMLRNGDDLVLAVTGQIETPCDISIMGWIAGEQVQTMYWASVESVESAALVFQQYLKERHLHLEQLVTLGD